MLSLLKNLALGDATRGAAGPGLPSGREMRRYLTGAALAALPCLAMATRFFGWRIWAMFLSAALAGALVEIVFAAVRKRRVSGGSMVFAAWLVLLLPPTIPLWMVAFGAAFGVFFGKEIFGGLGHNLFSPVLVSKAFLVYSYPQIVKGSYFGSMFGGLPPDGWIGACALLLLGGALMLWVRRDNLRVTAGIVFAATAVGAALLDAGKLPFETLLQMFASDGFLIGACIVACDPSGSPRTRNGLWLYALLIGALAVLMRSFSNYSEAMLSAVLLGNLFAPTLDALEGIRFGKARKGRLES